jgi:hypothetical protein
MQALVEKRLLTRRLWWQGLAAQGLGALLVALLFDIASSASFFGGGFALIAGTAASALYALRDEAPSGAGAMLGVLVGAVMKWFVVAALLVLAMVAPNARVPWVLAGLLFAQVVTVVAVMTFKRQ